MLNKFFKNKFEMAAWKGGHFLLEIFIFWSRAADHYSASVASHTCTVAKNRQKCSLFISHFFA
jgi:hypothetical protein